MLVPVPGLVLEPVLGPVFGAALGPELGPVLRAVLELVLVLVFGVSWVPPTGALTEEAGCSTPLIGCPLGLT